MGKKIKKANELNNMVIIYWVWKDGFDRKPTIKHNGKIFLASKIKVLKVGVSENDGNMANNDVIYHFNQDANIEIFLI